MSLKGTITDDMKSAMKAGDKDRLKVLRLILAAIKQVEVDTRVELDDPAVLGVLDKMVKQRRDSAQQFTKGGRDDLASIERAEIDVLEGYLPAKMDDTELDALIDEALNPRAAADVCRVDHADAALALDLRRRFLGALSIQIVDDDLRPRPR